jgi:hypothetical protein
MAFVKDIKDKYTLSDSDNIVTSAIAYKSKMEIYKFIKYIKKIITG